MRSVPLLFILALASIIFLPFFIHVYPWFSFFTLPIWIVYFIMDVHSTFLLYLKDYKMFFNGNPQELNRVFKYFVKKLDFKKAAIAYFSCVEVPCVVILSLIMSIPIGTLVPTYAFIASIGTIMFVSGLAHFDAWHNNVKIYKMT